MRRAEVWQYHIPMDTGVILRNQRLKQREGFLVRLTQNQQTGWGEIAPLPGFSQEDVVEARSVLFAWLDQWQINGEPSLPPIPSVAFGLSCALAELNGLLPEAADYRVAPLCTGDPDELILTLAAMPGEKIAKVKIGEYEAVRDGMVVNILLEAVPDLRLRLDANRRWTPLKAQQFAKYVNPAYRSRIAFIEEPCQSPDASRAFSQETGIAIAWDESLREEGYRFQSESGVVAAVIKPTLTGSLDVIQQQVKAAQQCGQTAVISSSLESSLGLTQLARIAAWLTPGVIPGLDTLSLMQTQVIRAWPESRLPCWQVDDLERIR